MVIYFDGTKVTIPKVEIPDNLKIGDILELFVYTGTDNVFLATPLTPKLKVNEFGFLKVKKQNWQCHFQINNVFNVSYQSHLSRLKYFEYYLNAPNNKLGIFNMGRNVSIKIISGVVVSSLI